MPRHTEPALKTGGTQHQRPTQDTFLPGPMVWPFSTCSQHTPHAHIDKTHLQFSTCAPPPEPTQANSVAAGRRHCTRTGSSGDGPALLLRPSRMPSRTSVCRSLDTTTLLRPPSCSSVCRSSVAGTAAPHAPASAIFLNWNAHCMLIQPQADWLLMQHYCSLPHAEDLPLRHRRGLAARHKTGAGRHSAHRAKHNSCCCGSHMSQAAPVDDCQGILGCKSQL